MKEIAKTILRVFKELDVPLNPASRLFKQIDVYLDPKGILPQIIPPDHPLMPTAVEAERDLKQIGFALRQLLPIVPREEMRARLRRVVSDNVLPQDNPEQSAGRDAQCELFVAALCASARLDPVFDESPDIRCKLPGQTFGVAVKRIKSPSERFDEAFKKATRVGAGQIARSQLPGIIVADVSQSRNPTNWWVPMEVSDFQFNLAWRNAMDWFEDRFKPWLLERTRGKNVRGLILIDHIPRCLPKGEWCLELRAWPVNLWLRDHHKRRHSEFELFYTRFNSVISDGGGNPTASSGSSKA
jgi:hypothetical protein